MASYEQAVFCARSLDALRAFPRSAQREAGYQIDRVQHGRDPDDRKPMKTERFASVWDAIEDTPAEAENMKLRAALMMALSEQLERAGLTQAEAAKLLGVTQPRVSDLVRGKINLFALDSLVNMAVAAGLRVEMRVRKAA